MPQTGTTQEYIGVAEAAQITGLNARTIHRKVQRGELSPISKLPGLRGAYIFNRADIEALKKVAA